MTQENSDDDRTERQKYYDAVDAAVDGIEDSMERGDDLDLPEEVWQALDSSEYIIYYDKNMTVLQKSSNEPGEWKYLVSEDDSWRDVIQALAYATMEQDLWDEIRERGLDE